MPVQRLRSRFAIVSVVVIALVATSIVPVAAALGPRVTSFTLINADTDRPIAGFDPLQPGSTLNLATLPTRNLNIQVNVSTGTRSVQVALNAGRPNIENRPPYAMTGDLSGDFKNWTPNVGGHTVRATAFAGPNATGTAGPMAALTFSVVDSRATNPPPPPTTQPPPPPPPNLAVVGQCGPMPTQTPSGWRRVMSDTFNENIPLGEWGRAGGRWEQPGGNWRARPAGWRDSSGRGTYSSPKTTSQHHGLMDVWVHSEGSTRYIAAPISLVGNTVGQRIALCMRADVIPGYKIAFMLWPSLGEGNERGEINFPEGKLSGGSATAHAFMHYDPEPPGGKKQDAYDSGVSVQGWHTYVMEWKPQAGYVAFYLDGRLVGRSTRYVPRGPMHYLMQIETYMSGQALPPPAQGHVLVDWVTIDVPAY